MSYENKYLKYKNKYLKLQLNQMGGQVKHYKKLTPNVIYLNIYKHKLQYISHDDPRDVDEGHDDIFEFVRLHFIDLTDENKPYIIDHATIFPVPVTLA